MEPVQIFITIVVIVVVAIAVLFIYQRIKMSRDPQYAARVSKRAADRDLARQKRKVARAEMKVKKARYREATAPAIAQLNRAKADYNNRVRTAEDALRHANSEHERAVREQEKKISDIIKHYSRELATVGTLRLFVDRLEVQDSQISLNDSFKAEIKRGAELLEDKTCGEFKFEEVTEDTRPTTPGVPVGGIGKPEEAWVIHAKADFCYLFVEGTCSDYDGKPLEVCVPLDDKRLDAGDMFEKQLAIAAPAAADNACKRDVELEEAYEQKSQIEADTQAISQAEVKLEQEQQNNQEVIKAQQNLEQAEKAASEELGYKP